MMYKTPTKKRQHHSDRIVTKKSKKEKSILFNPPFYQLLDDINIMISNKDGLSMRCCTCGSVVRGSKNVSSNFIKHLRRSHPTVKKMYDAYKIHQLRGGVLKPFTISHSNYKVSNTNLNEIFEDEQLLLQMSESRDEEINSATSEVDGETFRNSSENDETNENIKDIIPQNESVSIENTESNINNFSNKKLYAITQMIDEKLEHFVSKIDFNNFLNTNYSKPVTQQESEQADAPTSSTNKDNELFQELSEKVCQLQKEYDQLRFLMEQTQTSKWHLQNEINALERNLNQRKLVIKNLFIEDSLHVEKCVGALIEEKLGLKDISVLNATLLPTIKNGSDKNTQRGNVLIELKHVKDVYKIFGKVHKLKQTGVYIERESSSYQRKRKEKLLVLRKEILRRKSDIMVTFRNASLIIEDQTFYWDDVRGLCYLAKDQTNNSDIDVVNYLKTLTGLDLEEFINVLKNYNIQVS